MHPSDNANNDGDGLEWLNTFHGYSAKTGRTYRAATREHLALIEQDERVGPLKIIEFDVAENRQ